MIVDLDRFIANGRPLWRELESVLGRFERDPDSPRPVENLERFYYLYERAASDLNRLGSFAAPPELRAHLEGLIGRAYTEIHESRRLPRRFSPARFYGVTFPRAFRRRFVSFALACAATCVGASFGAGALALDPDAKSALMPFDHLLGDPSERVRLEESESGGAPNRTGAGEPVEARFSAILMTHNTRVALFCLALGMTLGFGTLVLLFYNGVLLGAVCLDYLRAGECTFLAGWLLPHGVIEIPAILIAGQAGLVLAAALLGRGSRHSLGERVRAAGPDLVVLAAGFASLLVWAGVVESFLSQLHEPRLPYALKIGFGLVELLALTAWLTLGGRKP